MSVTGTCDQVESDRPHRRCAPWEPFPVTEVRWFMIYFPINPSLLRALGRPVNKRRARLSPPCSPSLPRSCWRLLPAPPLSGLAKLGRASTVINAAYLYACMSLNWNKGRDGGEIKKPWMTELQWCWIQSEAGSLHTPGPPGRWWGLRVTQHQAQPYVSQPHGTFRKPIVRLRMWSMWERRPNVLCSLIPDQVFLLPASVVKVGSQAANNWMVVYRKVMIVAKATASSYVQRASGL